MKWACSASGTTYCRIRPSSEKIITFTYSQSLTIWTSAFTPFFILEVFSLFFCLTCRPKWNYVLIGYHLFDKIKPCIKQDEGTCLFLRATCQSYLIICSSFKEDGVDWRSRYSAYESVWKRMLVIFFFFFRILHFWLCVIFSLYIRCGLDSFTILDLLFYYYFNVTCKAHLNIFI